MQQIDIPTIENPPEIEHIEVTKKGNIIIRWCESIGAGRYVIKRSVGGNENYVKIAGVSGAITEYKDKNITEEGVYWYQVIAVKDYGADKPVRKKSKAICISVYSLEAPNLKETFRKDNNVHIKWDGVDGVDGYEIFKRYDFMKAGISIASVSKDTKSFVDEKCIHGPLFFYSVKSFTNNEAGKKYSNNSNEIAIVCFDKVKVLSAKKKLGKKVEFNVRLCSGADGYILFKSSDKNGEYKEVCRTHAINQFKLTDKALNGEKTVYYKIACYKNLPEGEIAGPMTDALEIKYSF